MPNNIGANARRTRHYGIVIDGDGPSPAALTLLVLLFGMILELDRATRASSNDGVIRSRAAVTRTPEDGRIYLAVCIGGGCGNGVCSRHMLMHVRSREVGRLGL